MVSAEVDLAAPVLTRREMNLNLIWWRRWRHRETTPPRERVAVISRRCRSHTGRAAERPLPRLRQLLFLGGAHCAAPGPLEHLLALPRLRQALRRDVMSQRLFPNFKSRRRRRGDATPP